MKTLSVKKAAEVLGIGSRAVLKRLSNGQLKGTRRTNKFGVEEWWIYPNKEIRAALEAVGQIDILSEQDGACDADIIEIDAESISRDGDIFDEESEPSDAISERDTGVWTEQARAQTNGVAEELWNNIISRFLGELKERDQLIGEMRSELADKDRQLKLLPDYQKRIEEERQLAEEERKAAELRALEVEALNKQINAIEVEKRRLEAKAAEADVATNRLIAQQNRENELKVQLQVAEKLKSEAEQARLELERQVAANKRAADEEVARLREEKAAETAAINEQLKQITARLEERKRPWYSWWLTGGQT